MLKIVDLYLNLYYNICVRIGGHKHDIRRKISNYIRLQKEQEELKTKAEELKVAIIEEMEKQGIVSTEVDNYGVNLSVRETIKYSDEPSIIRYCESNGLTNYIVKKVNTTSLNKELKKKNSLTEDLASYYVTTQSKVLTVKEK